MHACCIFLHIPFSIKVSGEGTSGLFSSKRLASLFSPSRSCIGSLISFVTLGDTAGWGAPQNPPKNKNKNELSKQLQQEQIHRNRDHMEGYQQRGGKGRMKEKVQGISSLNGRYKIDRGRLRIVWEMEKPKNLYV